MKAMYNKPTIDVTVVNTEYMMQDPVVSGGSKASEDPSNIYDGD